MSIFFSVGAFYNFSVCAPIQIGAMSSATSVIVDKEASAKNVVASKLGYGENEDSGSHEMNREGNATKSASPTNSCNSD